MSIALYNIKSLHIIRLKVYSNEMRTHQMVLFRSTETIGFGNYPYWLCELTFYNDFLFFKYRPISEAKAADSTINWGVSESDFHLTFPAQKLNEKKRILVSRELLKWPNPSRKLNECHLRNSQQKFHRIIELNWSMKYVGILLNGKPWATPAKSLAAICVIFMSQLLLLYFVSLLRFFSFLQPRNVSFPSAGPKFIHICSVIPQNNSMTFTCESKTTFCRPIKMNQPFYCHRCCSL